MLIQLPILGMGIANRGPCAPDADGIPSAAERWIQTERRGTGSSSRIPARGHWRKLTTLAAARDRVRGRRALAHQWFATLETPSSATRPPSS